MRVALEFTAQDVRDALLALVRRETSKHNHPAALNVQITVFDGEGKRGSLDDLCMEIHAVIEEKPEAP